VNQDIEQSHAERDLELNRNRQKKPQGGEKCGKKIQSKKGD
jgi:hypothetical protein